MLIVLDEAVLGSDAEEMMAKTFGDCVHPDDQATLKSLYAEIAGGKKMFCSQELRIRHKAGDWRNRRGRTAGKCPDESEVMSPF